MSLQYEPESELLHISVKLLFSDSDLAFRGKGHGPIVFGRDKIVRSANSRILEIDPALECWRRSSDRISRPSNVGTRVCKSQGGACLVRVVCWARWLLFLLLGGAVQGFHPMGLSCMLEYVYTLNPQPSTLNPQPSALGPQPSTLNPQPSTLNHQPSTLSPQPHSCARRCAARRRTLRLTPARRSSPYTSFGV